MSTYLTILQTNKIFVSGDQNIGKTKVSSVYLIQIYSLTSARCIFLNFQPMVNGFAIMRSVVSQSKQPPACIHALNWLPCSTFL